MFGSEIYQHLIQREISEPAYDFAFFVDIMITDLPFRPNELKSENNQLGFEHAIQYCVGWKPKRSSDFFNRSKSDIAVAGELWLRPGCSEHIKINLARPVQNVIEILLSGIFGTNLPPEMLPTVAKP